LIPVISIKALPILQPEELLRQCRQNNRLAQEAFYKLHYETLMRVTMLYFLDGTECLEVLNTAFLKIFRHLDKWRNEGPLEAWMRRIVVNCCMNQLTAKRQPAFAALDEQTEQAIEHPAPAVKLEYEDLLHMARSLPPATRAVFLLYAIEGYPHRDIGTALGISENTSKWHFAEARKKLQEMIARQGEGRVVKKRAV
jgi:RNA polymerase sigma factor (sigma-70 family)